MFIIDEYLKVIQETIDVVIFRFFFSGKEEQQEKIIELLLLSGGVFLVSSVALVQTTTTIVYAARPCFHVFLIQQEPLLIRIEYVVVTVVIIV